MTPALPVIRDTDVEIEVRDPGNSPLVRLFRWKGTSIGEPPVAHRNSRFDPPAGSKEAFSVLYAAENIVTAAVECRILTPDQMDRFTYSYQSPPHRVARLNHSEPALFIRITGESLKKWGVKSFQLNYDAYQTMALALFERYGTTVHGMSWDSFHRGRPGRNYGFWHSRLDTIGFRALQEEPNCLSLELDPDWKAFLDTNRGEIRHVTDADNLS